MLVTFVAAFVVLFEAAVLVVSVVLLVVDEPELLLLFKGSIVSLDDSCVLTYSSTSNTSPSRTLFIIAVAFLISST